MVETAYKIRNAIVVPVGIVFFSFSLLLLLSLLFKSLPGEIFALSVFFILAFCIFFEALSRRVFLGADGLEIKRFLRNKKLAWDDVTYAGSVVMRKKIYLLLTTTRGFYILSNNYERFGELLASLKGRLGEDRVEKEIDCLIASPIEDNRPVYSAWIMAAVVFLATVLRFYIHFSASEM